MTEYDPVYIKYNMQSRFLQEDYPSRETDYSPMPHSASKSSVLMKISRISAIRLVKQKKESASANSTRTTYILILKIDQLLNRVL